MSNKEIIDALKQRSDIFVERARKDSEQVLRLLKKARRSFVARRRRDAVGPGALLRVLEHAERVLEERRTARLNKMNDMIKELLSMSNTEHPLCKINIVNDVQLRTCSVTLQDDVLDEVENEFEVEMNRTIIEEVIPQEQMCHKTDLDESELECDLNNTVTEVTQDNKIYMEATVEIEKINYQPLVIESPGNINRDVVMIEDNDRQDDNMKNENIQEDNMQEDNIQEDNMQDNIQEDNLQEDNIQEYNIQEYNMQDEVLSTSNNSEQVFEETKANTENDSVKPSRYVDINTSTLNETFHVSISSNDSVDKIIPNVQQKTDLSNRSVTNSITSSLSISKTGTRTPNTSALFKSKFHQAIKISNTSGTKTQIKVQQSSALKRTANDVRQKKELIEEEKRQKLLAKFDDHEIRMKKMDELRKCALLVQSKAIHPSSNDITKMAPLSKPLLKNKDNTKTMPLSSIKSNQQAPSNKPIQQSSKINQQQLNASKMSRLNFSASKTNYQPITQQKIQNSSNLKTSNNFANQSILTKPILKPVNKVSKTSTDKVSSTPTMKSSFIFKTPSEKKSVNVLSESCRKIVINHESYSLAGLDSDNSDDEVDDSVPLPSWTNKTTGTLGRLSFYHLVNTDTESIFANPKLLPLSSSDVFRSYDHCVDNINNSGVWIQN